jgi:hypothetical protein
MSKINIRRIHLKNTSKTGKLKMKFTYTVLILWFLGSCSLYNIANAGPIKANINNLDTLIADYSQSEAGQFSSITGGRDGQTFHEADFNNLNGTLTTSDASTDSATFKLTVENLVGFSGNSKHQYLFESGGKGNGIGIFYNENNELVFSQRTQELINTVSIDASSLIGSSFDIVASISFEDNLMRLIIDDNLYAETALLSGSNDWSGRNGGAFGQGNNSLVSGNGSGRLFNSGQVADFSYFHDVVVFMPEPSSIAILALAIIGLAFRRLKK